MSEKALKSTFDDAPAETQVQRADPSRREGRYGNSFYRKQGHRILPKVNLKSIQEMGVPVAPLFQGKKNERRKGSAMTISDADEPSLSSEAHDSTFPGTPFIQGVNEFKPSSIGKREKTPVFERRCGPRRNRAPKVGAGKAKVPLEQPPKGAPHVDIVGHVDYSGLSPDRGSSSSGSVGLAATPSTSSCPSAREVQAFSMDEEDAVITPPPPSGLRFYSVNASTSVESPFEM